MNKKLFTYILLAFIALFGFNMNVDAANNLTCVYEGRWTSDAIMFKQIDNKVQLWRNSAVDDPDVSDKGWKIYNNFESYSSDSTFFDVKSKIFSGCPKYGDYTDTGGFYFYDNEDSMYYKWNWKFQHHKLIKQYDEALDTPNPNLYNKEDYTVDNTYTNTHTCSQVKDYFSSNSDNWLVNNRGSYDVSCLYMVDDDSNCHLLQIDFTNVDLRLSSTWQGTQGFSAGFSSMDIIEAYGSNMCPIDIYYTYGFVNPGSSSATLMFFSLTGDNKRRFSLIKSTSSIEKVKFSYEDIEINTCEDLLSEEIVSYLKFGFNAIRIAIPLILIAIGIVEFARGIFSSEDDMKKIQQKFIKRVIISLSFFLIPTVLKVLLDIANTVFGINADFCGLF